MCLRKKLHDALAARTYSSSMGNAGWELVINYDTKEIYPIAPVRDVNNERTYQDMWPGKIQP